LSKNGAWISTNEENSIVLFGPLKDSSATDQQVARLQWLTFFQLPHFLAFPRMLN